MKLLLDSLPKPPKIVEKAWGKEYWLVNEPYLYCCKLLCLKRGWQGSHHRHPSKDETFLVLGGRVQMQYGNESDKFNPKIIGKIAIMQPGDRVRVKAGTWHRFCGCEASEILEVSSYHSDKDVERREESKRFWMLQGEKR